MLFSFRSSYQHLPPFLSLAFVCTTTLSLTACDFFKKTEEQTLNSEQVAKLIPKRVKDRDSWASDIVSISEQLKIPLNRENSCSIIAVVDQESNFIADPTVAGLGAKAVKEIKGRLEEKFGKTMAGVFENMLKNQPTVEDNYLKQLGKVKTERELDQLYREIFSYFAKEYHLSLLAGASKLVGQDIVERFNPVTTLGSMQVHINYAKDNKRGFISINELRDSLYTQEGGLYYGIHRLMSYLAQYDQPIYRFADYNSGMYSSRNAAFQQMVNKLTDADLDLDGDLLIYNKKGKAKMTKSSTEEVLIQYFGKDPTAPSVGTLRSDLKTEKTEKFEKTDTYNYIKTQYEQKTHKDAPYAIMPQVVISGPKLSRDYNTNWYAQRVDGRYQKCIKLAKRLKLG